MITLLLKFQRAAAVTANIMDNTLSEYPVYLDRYFDILEKTGYIKPKDTLRLLILSFFDELLNGKYSEFTSLDDRRAISEFINLTSSTCFPYHGVESDIVIS